MVLPVVICLLVIAPGPGCEPGVISTHMLLASLDQQQRTSSLMGRFLT